MSIDKLAYYGNYGWTLSLQYSYLYCSLACYIRYIQLYQGWCIQQLEFSMLADITDRYLESDTKVIEDIMVYNARERIIQLILEEKDNNGENLQGGSNTP